MKKYVIGCIMALSSLAAPVFADYCCPPPPCEPCCHFDFNGFYVGGDLGIYSRTTHITDFDALFPTGGTRSVNTNNFTAGFLVGYDMECCNKLIGLVADWNWLSSRDRGRRSGAISTGSERHHDHHRWFGTIRGRAGITVCDALVYVTLGAAAFHRNFRGSSDTTVGNFCHRHCKWGWTGGVGTEFLLGCNWSVGAEILYLSFCRRDARFTSPIGPEVTRFRLGFSDTAFLGRIIVNYRFGDLFSVF